MKATLEKKQYDGNICSNRKENNFNGSYIALTGNNSSASVDARFYWTNTRCYCCVWIRGKDVSLSGGGYAGGYGYHKESAALSEALSNAGVKLSERIAGHGETAIRDAIEAVAKAASGKRKVHLIHAHG